MASKLIHVGNSMAVIIPAKLIRDLGLTEETLLELSNDQGSILIRKKPKTLADFNLPKLDRFPELDENLMKLGEGVEITEDDWKNDERLEHILKKCGYI